MSAIRNPALRLAGAVLLYAALAFLAALTVFGRPAAHAQVEAFGTPIAASSTGTTGAVTATLPAVSGHTTFLCSVQIGEAGSGTATATASNVTGGPLNYVVTAPGNFTVTYRPCLAAPPGTTIPVATTANSTATAVAVTVTGFQR
jgi:hypothetical protein